MEGKICLITGANSGIGKETAKELARMGAQVVMVCRNKEKGESVRSEIINEIGNSKIDLLLCDLSYPDQIRNLATKFRTKYRKLHVLINNAGVMLSNRMMTKEGIEMNFAVNYLAPFLLTCSLLDVLKESAPSRIINISSAAHRMAMLDFEDLQCENIKYKLFKVYGKSKLALMLFTYELSRRLEGTGVTANAIHPGLVNTNLGRDQSKFSQWFAKLFFKSPLKGAETSIYLASSPDVEGITGKYWIKKEQRDSSENSYNEEDAKKLWNMTAKITGEDCNIS